jgi:hypothetical protein
VWVDWEEQIVECAIKYGTDTEVNSPPKPGCESHADVKCYNNHVYWYDSCGEVEEKKEYCEQGCENGACKNAPTCTSHHQTKCYEGHSYWYDSCGNKEEKKQYCEHGCENGECLSEQCTSHHEYKCYGGYIYWYDSCGNKQEKKETCENGCEGISCIQEDVEPEPKSECTLNRCTIYEGDSIEYEDYTVSLTYVLDSNTAKVSVEGEPKEVDNATIQLISGLGVYVEDIELATEGKDSVTLILSTAYKSECTYHSNTGDWSECRIYEGGSLTYTGEKGLYEVEVIGVMDEENVIVRVNSESEELVKDENETLIDRLFVYVKDIYHYTTITAIDNVVVTLEEYLSECVDDICTNHLGEEVTYIDANEVSHLIDTVSIGSDGSSDIRVDNEMKEFFEGTTHTFGNLQVTTDEVNYAPLSSGVKSSYVILSMSLVQNSAVLNIKMRNVEYQEGESKVIDVDGTEYSLNLLGISDSSSLVFQIDDYENTYSRFIELYETEDDYPAGFEVTVEDINYSDKVGHINSAVISVGPEVSLFETQTKTLSLEGSSNEVYLLGVSDTDTVVVRIDDASRSIDLDETRSWNGFEVTVKDITYNPI